MPVGSPLSLILLGLAMMAGGLVVLFLSVIGIVASSLVVSSVAYLANTMGFFIGMIGLALYVRGRRRDD